MLVWVHHVDKDRFSDLVPKEVQNSIPEQDTYKHLSGKTNFFKPEKFVFFFSKSQMCIHVNGNFAYMYV